jgi:hypothetical protein
MRQPCTPPYIRVRTHSACGRTLLHGVSLTSHVLLAVLVQRAGTCLGGAMAKATRVIAPLCRLAPTPKHPACFCSPCAAIRAVVPSAGPPGTRISILGSAIGSMQSDCAANSWGDSDCINSVNIGEYVGIMQQENIGAVIVFGGYKAISTRYPLNNTVYRASVEVPDGTVAQVMGQPCLPACCLPACQPATWDRPWRRARANAIPSMTTPYIPRSIFAKLRLCSMCRP